MIKQFLEGKLRKLFGDKVVDPSKYKNHHLYCLSLHQNPDKPETYLCKESWVRNSNLLEVLFESRYQSANGKYYCTYVCEDHNTRFIVEEKFVTIK